MTQTIKTSTATLVMDKSTSEEAVPLIYSFGQKSIIPEININRDVIVAISIETTVEYDCK